MSVKDNIMEGLAWIKSDWSAYWDGSETATTVFANLYKRILGAWSIAPHACKISVPRYIRLGGLARALGAVSALM